MALDVCSCRESAVVVSRSMGQHMTIRAVLGFTVGVTCS